MPDNPPETVALALGELKGTVNGLVRTLEDQNKTAAVSREEFMEIFKGIRADSKEQAVLLQSHIKEDNLHHSALLELMTWKKDAELKVDSLWDFRQQNQGFLSATRLIT